MTASAGGSAALDGIPGVTAAVQAAGTLAYRQAYLDAYHTIFYVSIAFAALAVICNLLVPNVDDLMTSAVAAKLHEGKRTDGTIKKDVEQAVAH
jgi:hypothetical protein